MTSKMTPEELAKRILFLYEPVLESGWLPGVQAEQREDGRLVPPDSVWSRKWSVLGAAQRLCDERAVRDAFYKAFLGAYEDLNSGAIYELDDAATYEKAIAALRAVWQPKSMFQSNKP